MPQRKRIELYAFSFYDPVRRRWIRARYKAAVKDIEATYNQHRLEGEPEIREFDLDDRILGDHGPAD